MTDATDMTYARYLDLDRLLSAQHPLSDQHDEMLFVIIHQTKELWLKQILHEVALAKTLVRAGDLVPAYKSLARVSRIQAVMTQSWDILSTMTPADYLSFREKLGASSGFQSDQFRTVEYLLGLKDGAFLKYQQDRPVALSAMEQALAAPSLWDNAIAALARFRLLAREMKLKRLDVVATAAVRDATNGDEFLDRAIKAGVDPRVITGEEEARLAVLGCHALLEPGEGPALIFDIGGGSTELVLVEAVGEGASRVPRILDWQSVPWGVVSLTDTVGRAEDSEERRGGWRCSSCATLAKAPQRV